MFLKKIFKFDAAHNLTKYHGKCEKLHGHTYRVVITIEGKPDKEDMVMDFAELKEIVKKEAIDILDHSYLNDLIENPTAENIARWIWQRIYDRIKAPNRCLFEVEVWETEDSGVILRGEDL